MFVGDQWGAAGGRTEIGGSTVQYRGGSTVQYKVTSLGPYDIKHVSMEKITQGKIT